MGSDPSELAESEHHSLAKPTAGTSGTLRLALAVAALPFVGYVLVFCFETGYLRHFHISRDLVRIEASQFAWAVVVAVPVFPLVFIALNSLIVLLAPMRTETGNGEPVRRARGPLWRATDTPLLVALLMGFYVWATGKSRTEILMYAGAYVGITALWFGIPLLTQVRTKGYANKLERQERVDRLTPDLMSFSRGLLIPITILLAMGLLVGGLLNRPGFNGDSVV